MIKNFFFFNIFIIIHSLNIFNLTENYSNGNFKNIFLDDEYFFINTDKYLYKSLISNGLNTEIKTLNYSENSSIIFIPELDIFVAACTKDFFIGIINSTLLDYIETYNDDKNNFQENENKCKLYYFSNENKHNVFLAKHQSYYLYEINETSKKINSNQTINIQNVFNIKIFSLFKNENFLFFSSFYNSTK